MDRVFISDASRLFRRFCGINKWFGIIILKIKDGNGNIKVLNMLICVAHSPNSLLFLASFQYNNSYEIRYNVHKHIETTERGLVIVAAHESDSGRYDCHLGGSLLCSYTISVDAHR
jgi:hypothetical protein